MATTPKLTRSQIARIVNNDEQAIRLFESLISRVFVSSPEDISALVTEVAALRDDVDEINAEESSALAGVLSLDSIVARLSDIVSDVPPPPIQPTRPKYYGAFSDSTTQTAAAINTAYPVTFDTIDFSYGVSIGTPASRVYVDNPGVYNFQFSAQLDKTGGGAGLVFIWCRVNGVDVPRSAGRVRLKDSSSESVPAWNYVLEMNAGDYFELVWGVDDTSIELAASAASSPYPAVPSVILTVTDNIS